MKKHTKIYMEFFGIGEQDTPICERCNLQPAVDVHHCKMKGMGGNPNLDRIENLVGLCRKCHEELHRNPEENKEAIREAKDIDFRKKRMDRLMRGID